MPEGDSGGQSAGGVGRGRRSRAKAIHVIDGKTPQELPAGPVLIFTPGACDLWQLGEAVADPLVSRVDESSPIMAGVRLFDAYLPEARQLKIAESVRARCKADPLGRRDAAGLCDRPSAGPRGGDRPAIWRRAIWRCKRRFPQLIAQALDWLDGQSPWKDEVQMGKS